MLVSTLLPLLLAVVGEPNPNLLVSAGWLAANARSPRVVVLHIARDQADYNQGHIPGARFIQAPKLWTTTGPGVELPTVAYLDSLFESVGVSTNSRVILYGEAWTTPRAFLALDYLGLGDQAAILDGGLAAWKALGQPVSTEAVTSAAGTIDPKPRGDMVVDAAWIEQHLNDPKVALVDGRSPEEYAGSVDVERLPRYGHIPGAKNLPWDQTYSDGAGALNGLQSNLVDAKRLAALMTAAGVTDAKQIVTYCTVGLRASHLYFIARLLGHHPKIYDGSIRDWSPRNELPLIGPPPKAATPPPSEGLAYFVDPDWLHNRFMDHGLVVLHVDRNRAAYDSSHIEGARFVALSSFVTERNGIATELPSTATLDSLLEGLGIGPQSKILLYGDILAVSRLFFTLDYLGLAERTVVLNGGLAAWKAGGHPVSALGARHSALGTGRSALGGGGLGSVGRDDIVVTADWVRQSAGKPNVVVVDARKAEEYAGTAAEEGVARAGHIPGARNLDWASLFENGRVKDKATLTKMLEGIGVTGGKTIVTYCRVGTRAAALYLVARALGLPTKMYDGSMVEWSSRTDLPVATGPAAGSMP